MKLETKTVHPDLAVGRVLAIAEGEILKHDTASGPLCADCIVNNGTIEIFTTDEDSTSGTIAAQIISGSGSILCVLPRLTIEARELSVAGGIRADELVTVKSPAE